MALSVKSGLFIALVAGAVAVAAPQTSALAKAEQNRDPGGSFDRVNLKGSMDVEVKVGEAISVRVVADEDRIDDIETFVENGTLVIRTKRGVRWSWGSSGRSVVYVTVPELSAAVLQGSGDMEVTGPEAGSFDLTLQGSGDLSVDAAKFGSVEVLVQGSGDIKLDGNCDALTATVQGSGDIEADDLRCKSAELTVQGSGDIDAFASERVQVDLRGSGDVTVSGSPAMVDRYVRGSGEVRMRGR